MAASPYAMQAPPLAVLLRALNARQAAAPTTGDEVGVSTPSSMTDNGPGASQVGGGTGFMYGIPAMSGGSLPPPPHMAPRAPVAESASTPQEDMQSAYEKAADAARARTAAILARGQQGGISDRDRWLALALGGARMASSRNPTFFGALGEGAAEGIQNFSSMDQRAKQAAFRQAEQELGAENMAERAGDRAENRVIRREDIAARKEARLDAIAARREDIEARLQDRTLDREQRAALERERTAILVEQREMDRQSREAIAAGRDAASIQRAELAAASRAARAAGAPPARIREAEALVEKGKAPDFGTAYDMVRAGVNDLATYQRNVQSAKNDLRKGLSDITGKLTVTEEELEERARELVRQRGGSAPGPAPTRAAAPSPVPAAPPPAAPGTVRRYNPATGKLE